MFYPNDILLQSTAMGVQIAQHLILLLSAICSVATLPAFRYEELDIGPAEAFYERINVS